MDAERDALVALYRATGGDTWGKKQGWCTDAPLSEWYGVKVSDGRVVELNLMQNNLQGEVYPSVVIVPTDRCRANPIGITSMTVVVVMILSDRCRASSLIGISSIAVVVIILSDQAGPIGMAIIAIVVTILPDRYRASPIGITTIAVVVVIILSDSCCRGGPIWLTSLLSIAVVVTILSDRYRASPIGIITIAVV